jgi:indole-3-glycerol phosphate synthase
MSNFLQSMARGSAERAAAAGTRFSSADFDKPLVALTPGAFDVIAEIKERSPAEGTLKSANHDRAEQAKRYAEGGALAISVLTEPSRFDGDLSHLEEVADAVPGTPVMRKDFLVDPVQVREARKAGASGVLLIATMLNDRGLRDMLDAAWEHDMFVLLESFDADDLSRASRLLEIPGDADRAATGQLLFGVNTRNLRTLAVDGDRLRTLAPLLPGARCVAESGLKVGADAATVAGYGYRAALVGTALMRSEDPAALIMAMRAAGSAVVAA